MARKATEKKELTYKVVAVFNDKLDNFYAYKIGDEYPRSGYEPNEERIKTLSTKANSYKKVFIKKD